MGKLYRNLLFSTYILISVVALFYVSYQFWIPLNPSDYQMILIYLLLLVIVNSSPLRIGDIYVMFTLAISLTAFLEYGLVVEVWLSQIAMLVSMLIPTKRRNFYRLVLSQMMFIWVSLAAGFSFFFAGGTIGFTVPMVKGQLLPILLYTISYFVVNNIILYLTRRIIEQQKILFFSDELLWDATTFLFTLPLGLIMYLVKITYGTIGMLFVSLLIITVTYLFKLYSELLHSHQQLKSLNKLSASFTSELNFDKTIVALQQSIRELLTFDYSYIYLVEEDKLKLTSAENFDGQMLDQEQINNFQLLFGQGLSGKVALMKKSEMIGTDAEIYQLEIAPDFLKGNQSLLSVPMLWNNEAVGVITLGAKEEYHFSKKDMTIANILASQAAIAIQNAKIYQKTEQKSFIDELTGSYNYRAFEDILHKIVAEADMKKETVSLLLLDLDHFKRVNDQYGHMAGNVVLKQIASILKEHTRRDDVIARYGGEEFTVILPRTEDKQAERIADRIRQAIQDKEISVKGSLHHQEETIIRVTVSIGVASFPDMAESAKDLVRNADRAMYVGSKQAGRNRVAVYRGIK